MHICISPCSITIGEWVFYLHDKTHNFPLYQTTLARIIARVARSKQGTRFTYLSASTCGVSEVKEVVKVAKNERIMLRRKTILFIDEIHRFNKLQQVKIKCMFFVLFLSLFFFFFFFGGWEEGLLLLLLLHTTAKFLQSCTW